MKIFIHKLKELNLKKSISFKLLSALSYILLFLHAITLKLIYIKCFVYTYFVNCVI